MIKFIKVVGLFLAAKFLELIFFLIPLVFYDLFRPLFWFLELTNTPEQKKYEIGYLISQWGRYFEEPFILGLLMIVLVPIVIGLVTRKIKVVWLYFFAASVTDIILLVIFLLTSGPSDSMFFGLVYLAFLIPVAFIAIRLVGSLIASISLFIIRLIAKKSKQERVKQVPAVRSGGPDRT